MDRMTVEELTPEVVRKFLVDVAGERLSRGEDQRVDLRLAALQAEKPERPTGPVNLIKAQCRHFAAAHPVWEPKEASSPGRHHPGIVGDIISEWAGDFKSEWRARSARNAGRHRAESAACRAH